MAYLLEALSTLLSSQRWLQGPAHFPWPWLPLLSQASKHPGELLARGQGSVGAEGWHLPCSPTNRQDMRVIGLPLPPIPVCPECPHSNIGGPQTLTALRIQSGKMQASRTCHRDQRLGVRG